MSGDPFTIARHLATGFDPFMFGVAPQNVSANWASSARAWNGDKYPGSFGETKTYYPDYWELRERSAQLFRENLYARGLVRRLITNEINVGLTLEAEPNDSLLPGLAEEAAEIWADTVENRFEIWANNSKLCDYEERRTFGQLQKEARQEALVEGDVLCVLKTDRRTGLPKIQLVRGGRVRSPLRKPMGITNKITHGVEIDDRGRHVAYWVGDVMTEPNRIPAFGSRSGRRLAWLEYGTDRRSDAVRGEPLLGLVLSSIKELDRYRDSELRAATINSMLAMFIQKTQDKPGTRPFTAGATRTHQLASTGLDGEPREFNISSQWPGMVLEELQHGEEPVSFDTKRPNATYPQFEAAIIHAIAWANEVPPEILTLAFSNNFSASKAAINEFKTYIVKVRKSFGDTFCHPVYVEYLTAEVLKSRIDAPGFLEAHRNADKYEILGAWTRGTWGGPVKPSVEMRKDVQAYGEAIELRLVSRDRAAKDIFGVRFATVMKRLKKEERLIRKMNDELGISNDPEPVPAPVPVDPVTGLTDAQLDAVADNVVDIFKNEGGAERV